MKKIKLSSLCSVRFGVHQQPLIAGDVQYLQARHFDNFGNIENGIDAFITYDDPKHLLKDGDVLLVAKGNRNFAWCYKSEMGTMIASSVFFVITPNQQKLNPEYLAVILNLMSAQQYFLQNSEGSSIQSIRKNVLEDFVVALPDLQQQLKIVSYTNTHLQLLQISEALIKKNKELYNAVITKMIN